MTIGEDDTNSNHRADLAEKQLAELKKQMEDR